MAARQPPAGSQLDRSHALSVGLVGYWPLNEPGGQKAYDLVQGARGVGAVTGTTIAPGQSSGTSRKLNGSSDKIVATSINATDGQISGSLTFAAWIAPTNSSTNGNALGSPGSSSYYVFLGPNSGGKLQFAMFDGSNNPIIASSVAYTIGQWYFIAGVRDKSTALLSLYVNGVLIGTVADNTVGVNGYTGITIGDTTTLFYSGQIENCRVYNRALRPSEIQRLYAEPYAGIVFERRLARRFSGGSGTNVLAGVGAVVATGFAPTVSVSNNQNVLAGVGIGTLTGFAPTVFASNNRTVAAGVGAATLTGFAPSVVATANQFVNPGVGVVTCTGFAPLVSIGNTIAAGVGVVTVTGFAPSVVATNNITVAAGVGLAVLTGFAPTVFASNTRNVLAGSGVATLTGFAPTVTIPLPVNVRAGLAQLTLTGFAPIVGGLPAISVGPQPLGLAARSHSTSLAARSTATTLHRR